MARTNTNQLMKDINTYDKTLKFYNSEGVKKEYDVHHYGNDGALLFKKKTYAKVV